MLRYARQLVAKTLDPVKTHFKENVSQFQAKHIELNFQGRDIEVTVKRIHTYQGTAQRNRLLLQLHLFNFDFDTF